MASRKRPSVAATAAVSTMLEHRARPGLGPESENPAEEQPPSDPEYSATSLVLSSSATDQSPEPEPEGDSSSEYVNNTSEEDEEEDEDEDYDEGLPEEEEGVTYYIRYCPEDDSYLDGTSCPGRRASLPDTDECQEAVEDWPGLGAAARDDDDPHQVDSDLGRSCASEHGDPDFCPPARDPEDPEEDIDQIVAEIKMSLSLSSIASAANSPERTRGPGDGDGGGDGDGDSDTPRGRGPGRQQQQHEARPRSLNLLMDAQHPPEPQRSLKAKSRTPEERPKWSPEQACNSLEQPRKQQRSDLNGRVDNNNIPETKKVASFPSFVAVPGPCEPEDLIDGIIFAANYLGSAQLLSERNPSKTIRMTQAQEAVSRVKSSEGGGPALTEVDLFISTQRIKVLNADTQETMMDHALRTISYIADIGSIVVLMARRRMPRSASQDCIESTPGAPDAKKQYKMICHVFESEDAQLIAQSIGQAFSVAYQEFLRANGINPEDLSQKDYSDILNTQEMYNDDLAHFSNSDNCKELQLDKLKGEILGVVVVESGWGSILPTVILANMMNGGPAARSGKLSIGDQIMSINGTSLVGLPLATCQGIIKGLKQHTQVRLSLVSCPPVTTVLIKRPDLKYQLGFSVQNGIICSLMRGGIAERGGVRVGHRIIEINGQSVVATAHEKIVQALSNSVGEIHMKTMPAAMFRLLTGQETPLYI
ncbi:amyloid-beta A4 precursor protein-binding family A member 2 isoform X2 [Suncus etruscus]|uniref:amyloid-beta A4 precursor protein-binding family A member 2 isoform X2 n=1 Tax=Suncus etruscus TaxID=109475 RepID=UPI00210F8975|nr:amyloid-beta A4 precursor protein-binding family A member 2 isoform X2 [Suncus etruscus]